MKIKYIIIDDEPSDIRVIEKYLLEFENFELIATYTNPFKAIGTIKAKDVDVIFLDINMSKMDGFEFIRNLETRPNIVITTARREYAVDSFTLDVLDYLIKPIPFNRFLKSINRITQQVYLQKGSKNTQIGGDSHIFLKVNKKLVKIKFEDVFYIESVKDYIKIYTVSGDYLVHKSLTGITEELPKNSFIRVHRSFTIAIDKVKSIEGNWIEISTKKIPIGRKYVNHVKRIILQKY